MLVCWVEDEDTPYETFMQTLENKGKKGEFKFKRFTSFEEAKESLSDFNYSLLILDLRDADDGERKGDDILRLIFESQFKPTIIYSAVEPENIGNDEKRKHPLVKYVEKKAGSDLELLIELESFKKKVGFLSKVKSTIDTINFQLLKNTFPIVEQDQLPSEVMERLFARRIAASLDFAFHMNGSTKIDPCEMYLYPPLPNTDLLTGDIIKNNASGNYFVILSPSCDMAQLHSRTPKIPNVLIAGLELIESILASAPHFKDRADSKKLTEILKSEKGREPREGKIYFPRLNDSLPGFLVNLKKLQLLDIKLIGLDSNETKDYSRIASMDSPFRESFSTLATQEMNRFGLPDFDYDKWGEGYWQVHPKKTPTTPVTAMEIKETSDKGVKK